jgi:ribosomal protein S27E
VVWLAPSSGYSDRRKAVACDSRYVSDEMKSTIVGEDGSVRCPVCGAVNSFTSKRTAKAKVIGVATVGVGVLAMPKRLKCNGCGTNLKHGLSGNARALAQIREAKQAKQARADQSDDAGSRYLAALKASQEAEDEGR